MSDKQFAGYLWMRGGGHNSSISKSRLLAHCSAAVRPRADIKARAYNLLLDLEGRQEADDLAALLEDREGSRALMRATRGDPEDITKERLPYILDRVRLAAGEFAAAAARAEGDKALEAAKAAHIEELASVAALAKEAELRKANEAEAIREQLSRVQLDAQTLAAANSELQRSLFAASVEEKMRTETILKAAFKAGKARYALLRWLLTLAVALAAGFITWLASDASTLPFAICAAALLGAGTFWFVPGLMNRPFHSLAMRHLKSVVNMKDASIKLPATEPDFCEPRWSFELERSALTTRSDE